MATLYLGNLDSRVTQKHLYELGIQAGPVVRVSLPQVPSGARGYGFIEYADYESCSYALRLLAGRLCLYGRQVSVAPSKAQRPSTPVPKTATQEVAVAAALAAVTPPSSRPAIPPVSPPSEHQQQPPLPPEPSPPLPPLPPPALQGEAPAMQQLHNNQAEQVHLAAHQEACTAPSPQQQYLMQQQQQAYTTYMQHQQQHYPQQAYVQAALQQQAMATPWQAQMLVHQQQQQQPPPQQYSPALHGTRPY